MIAMLSGKVISKDLDRIILDVHGVGYQVFISSLDYEGLASDATASIYIYEQIREDAYILYGFLDEQRKLLFEQLLSVKNVGPKAAMAVLNLGATERIKDAIANADTAYLSSAKGIGKRAAEQLIVELRDKVGRIQGTNIQEALSGGAIDYSDEALQALVSLGFNEQEATRALKDIDPGLDSASRVKLALKGGKG